MDQIIKNVISEEPHDTIVKGLKPDSDDFLSSNVMQSIMTKEVVV